MVEKENDVSIMGSGNHSLIKWTKPPGSTSFISHELNNIIKNKEKNQIYKLKGGIKRGASVCYNGKTRTGGLNLTT